MWMKHDADSQGWQCIVSCVLHPPLSTTQSTPYKGGMIVLWQMFCSEIFSTTQFLNCTKTFYSANVNKTMYIFERSVYVLQSALQSFIKPLAHWQRTIYPWPPWLTDKEPFIHGPLGSLTNNHLSMAPNGSLTNNHPWPPWITDKQPSMAPLAHWQTTIHGPLGSLTNNHPWPINVKHTSTCPWVAATTGCWKHHWTMSGLCVYQRSTGPHINFPTSPVANNIIIQAGLFGILTSSAFSFLLLKLLGFILSHFSTSWISLFFNLIEL